MQADAVPKSAPEGDGLFGFDETRVERQTNRRAGMQQAAEWGSGWPDSSLG